MGAEWGMRLRIEQAGAQILHSPARPVSPEELRRDNIQQLIELMFATLANTGVGLAAPQVGVGLAIVVIADPADPLAAVRPELLEQQERVPVEPHVLVNPSLVVEDPTAAEFFEGCLSVDGYRAIVPRARRVRVAALDRLGQPFERQASGWYARILQHEVDHLAGRLYLERMLPRTFVSAAAAQRFTAMSVKEAKQALGEQP